MSNKHTIFINTHQINECKVCHFIGNELESLPECSELVMVNKEWIDNATYEEILERNKTAHPCDTMLLGDMGRYFLKTITEKREKQHE